MWKQKWSGRPESGERRGGKGTCRKIWASIFLAVILVVKTKLNVFLERSVVLLCVLEGSCQNGHLGMLPGPVWSLSCLWQRQMPHTLGKDMHLIEQYYCMEVSSVSFCPCSRKQNKLLSITLWKTHFIYEERKLHSESSNPRNGYRLEGTWRSSSPISLSSFPLPPMRRQD